MCKRGLSMPTSIRLLVLLASLQAIAVHDTSAQTLRFSAMEGSSAGDPCSVLLKQAYQNLGIDFKLLLYPGLRALEMANLGKVDGELARIEAIGDQYPNLVRVDVPLCAIEAVFVVTNTDIQINSPNELTPFALGIRRGIAFIDKELEGLDLLRKVTVNNDEQLMRLLQAGAVDVVIMMLSDALEAKRSDSTGKVRIIEPPFASYPLYHYLHKSHAALARQLKAELRKVLDARYRDGANFSGDY